MCENKKGLYIVTSELFQNNGIIKFGMTTNYPERLKFYNEFMKKPLYSYIYLLNDNSNKEIHIAESVILKKTIDIHATGWQTEYRKITSDKMNDIIINELKLLEYKYEVIKDPKFKDIKQEKIKDIERNRLQDEYIKKITNNLDGGDAKIF